VHLEFARENDQMKKFKFGKAFPDELARI
jgi:hypothetical protein